jgi:lysozyme
MDKSNLPPITKFIGDSEGFESKPYKCTAGYLTIGKGRNLEAVGLRQTDLLHFQKKYGLQDEDAVWAFLNSGIDEEDADVLLANDIAQAKVDIKKVIPYFSQLPSFIQYVLLDMIFNIGVGNGKKGLKGFKKMLAAIGSYHMQGDPTSLNEAAIEMLDASYPDGYLFDTKKRAVRNAKLLCDNFEKVKKGLSSRPNREKHMEYVLKYGGK